MPKKKIGESTIVAGIIVNIFLPGLGTIIFGEKETGIIQLVLSLTGVVLVATIIGAIIGYPLWIALWIWALITGIKTLNDSRK